MKELTPKRSQSFSLCLYLSKSYSKEVFFFLSSDTFCQSSFIFSANSVLLSSNKYISSSSSCLSLKFYYSYILSYLILFYFRFMISSNCQIIIYVPYESLESFYYFFFYQSSRINYLSRDRTFCSNNLNLLIYISNSVYVDLLPLILPTIYLISFNFDKDRVHFSPIFTEFLPLRMVFSYDDVQASFQSRKTMSSQISNLSKEECRIVYISLLPIICVAFWVESWRYDQS